MKPSKKPNSNDGHLEMAASLARLRDAFLSHGFSAEQAYELSKTYFTTTLEVTFLEAYEERASQRHADSNPFDPSEGLSYDDDDDDDEYYSDPPAGYDFNDDEE